MIEACVYRKGCNGRDCDKAFCMKKYRLDTLFSKSLLTDEQKKPRALYVDKDRTDLLEFQHLAQIEQNIEAFVTEGQNLYLHSATCGNGKTSWAIKLLASYFYKIWHKSNFECQALFISVPRYLLALKENITNPSAYVEEIHKYVYDADLVIWDDIAAKTGSEFELTHLLNLINTRIEAGKSNIFTTNLDGKQLTSALGERLSSRIVNRSIEITLHGTDKRHWAFLKKGDE